MIRSTDVVVVSRAVVSCVVVSCVVGVVVAVVGAAPLRAADRPVTSQIGLWLEEDTNPRRLPDEPIDDDKGAATAIAPDGLLRFALSLGLNDSGNGRVLRLDTAVGGKLFFNAASERMLVGQTRAAAAAAIDDDTAVIAGASAKLRGQLSGSRTYGSFRGDLAVERAVMRGLSLRLGVDGASFLAFDNDLFSFAGGGLLAGGRYSHDKERIDFVVDAGLRGFPFSPPTPGTETDDRRVDVPLVLAVSATSARRLYLSAGYTLVRNESNARGERYTRHRLQLTGGARLPAQVTATAQAAVQLTSYDDGVSLGQRYFLADDDETQNLVELSLQRPLFGGLILEARAGFLSNELAQDGARFARATAAVGLRCDL